MPNEVVGVSAHTQLSVDRQRYKSYDSTSQSKLVEMIMVPKRVFLAHLINTYNNEHSSITSCERRVKKKGI